MPTAVELAMFQDFHRPLDVRVLIPSLPAQVLMGPVFAGTRLSIVNCSRRP